MHNSQKSRVKIKNDEVMNLAEKVVVSPHMFLCLDAEGENYVVEV
jgi:hypothetical protein